METNGGSVRCAGGSLGQHRHICAFFNDFDEQHRVLRSFIKEGFERGDKAFHIVDPSLWEDHLQRLAEAGIDVERARGTGQLECGVGRMPIYATIALIRTRCWPCSKRCSNRRRQPAIR